MLKLFKMENLKSDESDSRKHTIMLNNLPFVGKMLGKTKGTAAERKFKIMQNAIVKPGLR